VRIFHINKMKSIVFIGDNMINFKFKKTDISFLFSFFALFAVLFYSDNSFKILIALLACFLHEAGHLAVMLIYDCKPKRILFYGGGIKIIPNCRLLSYEKDIAVNFAGCFVNIISGLITMRLGVFEDFSQASIVIGIFNLLPFSNFDGGHIIKLFFERKENEKYLYLYKTSVKVLCIAVLFAGIYSIVYFRVNVSLIVTICYIIISELFS